MSSDEEDLSVEPLQLPLYTADTRRAWPQVVKHSATSGKINVWQPLAEQHTGIMVNLEICS